MLLYIGYFYCFKGGYRSLYLRELIYTKKHPTVIALFAKYEEWLRVVWHRNLCGCWAFPPAILTSIDWNIRTSQVMSQRLEKSRATPRKVWVGRKKSISLWRGIASAVPSKAIWISAGSLRVHPYHCKEELLKNQEGPCWVVVEKK